MSASDRLAARALLVAPSGPDDLPPRLVIDSFEGRDIHMARVRAGRLLPGEDAQAHEELGS